VPRDQFHRFAWAVLVYNVLVILWGAYVRASGSGAGCGSHWPLCNGEVFPPTPRIETIIEFTHRITSGLAVMGAALLWLWSYKVFPKRHIGRKTAALSVVFLFAEALLGAGLVLLRYVAKDASAGRAFYLSAHLTNTQLLLAMLTATAWLSGWGRLQPAQDFSPANRRRIKQALVIALVAGVSGAIAALGDTLYPAASLAGGLQSELAASAPVLMRLRMLHPAISLAAAAFLVYAAIRTGSQSRAARAVIALVGVQIAAGILNWLLLAPIWMQIVHLLIADLLWIALVTVYLEVREVI
jgi:cytochrome c oxidase assembly protein subunit 15/protoheme IX farnesyltransferase